jgi:hypothetical protein
VIFEEPSALRLPEPHDNLPTQEAQQDSDSDSDSSSNDYKPRRRLKKPSRTPIDKPYSLPTSTSSSKSPLTSLWSRISSKLPTLTRANKDILKCGIAYFIAELFTFEPHLASILSVPFEFEKPATNGHVVATFMTYFAPNRTIGGMIEADVFMFFVSF